MQCLLCILRLRTNHRQGQRIMILQVVLTLFKRNNRLWPVNFENSKLWTTRKSFVLCTRRQSALWKCLLSEAFCSLVEKWELQFYLSQIVRSNNKNILSVTNELFYQSFCSAPLTFRTFSPSWKSSVYRHASASRLWNVYCLLFSDKISRLKR